MMVPFALWGLYLAEGMNWSTRFFSSVHFSSESNGTDWFTCGFYSWTFCFLDSVR